MDGWINENGADGSLSDSVPRRTITCMCPAPATSPVEAPFELEDLFFSTTDTKGFIRSANAVFTRVSEFPVEEWTGAPHKLVRHPDMPRAVFRILWDGLGRGEPVAAYVKNRTKDGGFYWVLALAFPIGGEYFSLRLKPSAGLLPTVERLYHRLLLEERAVEVTETRTEAIGVSLRVLDEELHALGFAGYEPFMLRILPAEVSARFAHLGSAAGRLPPPPRQHDLAGVHRACAAGLGQLVQLSARLEGFEALASSYREATAQFAMLADEVTMFALNAGFAAAATVDRAEVLGAIARLMRIAARDVAEDVEQLTDLLDGATAHIRSLSFAIASSSLALEIVGQFLSEIDAATSTSERSRHDAEALIASTVEQLDRAADLFDELPTILGTLQTSVRRVLSHLRGLRILRIRAEVDSAGDASAVSFSEIVGRVEEHLLAGLESLRRLDQQTQEVQQLDARSQARELRGRARHLSGHRGAGLRRAG